MRNNFLCRYFDDPWQNLPKDGYTTMFENMLLKDPKITVRVSTDYFKYDHCISFSLECSSYLYLIERWLMAHCLNMISLSSLVLLMHILQARVFPSWSIGPSSGRRSTWSLPLRYSSQPG